MSGSTGERFAQVLHADGGQPLKIAGGDALLDAEFVRSGPDLVLVGPDGAKTLVVGYFAVGHAPALVGATAHIDATLAAKLAGPMAPGQFAQAGGGHAGAAAIGKVQIAKGTVEVKHADGTKEVLKAGDPVYSDDVVVTDKAGSVGVLFNDGTTFSLGSSGRMVLDDMVYDGAAKSGHGAISLVKGSFAFVSGQIPKSHPDALTIKTPVMTMGIRGTAGGGTERTVAMLPEAGGVAGEISISTQGGSITLNQPGTATTITNPFAPPSNPFTMSPAQIGQLAGSAFGALPNPGALSQSFRDSSGVQMGPPSSGPGQGGEGYKPPPGLDNHGQNGQNGGQGNGLNQALHDLRLLQHQLMQQAQQQAVQEIQASQQQVQIKVEEAREDAEKKARELLDRAEENRAQQENAAVEEINSIIARMEAYRDAAEAAVTTGEAAFSQMDLTALLAAKNAALAGFNGIDVNDADPTLPGIQTLYAQAQAIFAAHPNFTRVATLLNQATLVRSEAETAYHNVNSLYEAATNTSGYAATWRDNSAIDLKVAKAAAAAASAAQVETKRLAAEDAATQEAAARLAARDPYINAAAAAAEKAVRDAALAETKVSLAKAIVDYVTRFQDADDLTTDGINEAQTEFGITTALKNAVTAYNSAVSGFASGELAAFNAGGSNAVTVAFANLEAAAIDNAGANLDANGYALNIQAWIDARNSAATAATSANTAYTAADQAYQAAVTVLNTAISNAATAALAYVNAQTTATNDAVTAASAAYSELISATAAQLEVESRMDAAIDSLLEDLGNTGATTLGTAIGDVAVAANAASAAAAAVASDSAFSMAAVQAANSSIQAAIGNIATRVSEVNDAVAKALAAKNLADTTVSPTHLSQASQQAQDLANQQHQKAVDDYAQALSIQKEVLRQQDLVDSYADQVTQAVVKAQALQALADAQNAHLAAQAVAIADIAQDRAEDADTAAAAAATAADTAAKSINATADGGETTDFRTAFNARVTAANTTLTTLLGDASAASASLGTAASTNAIIQAKILAANQALQAASTALQSATTSVSTASGQAASATTTAEDAADAASSAATSAHNYRLTADTKTAAAHAAGNDADAVARAQEAAEASKQASTQASLATEKAAEAALQVKTVSTLQTQVDTAVATASTAVKNAVEAAAWAKTLITATDAAAAARLAVDSPNATGEAVEDKAAIDNAYAGTIATNGDYARLQALYNTYVVNQSASASADQQARAAIESAYNRATQALKEIFDAGTGKGARADAATALTKAQSALTTAETKAAAALAATKLSDAVTLSADAQSSAAEAQRQAAIVETARATAASRIDSIHTYYTSVTGVNGAKEQLDAAAQMKIYADQAAAQLALAQSFHATVVKQAALAQAQSNILVKAAASDTLPSRATIEGTLHDSQVAADNAHTAASNASTSVTNAYNAINTNGGANYFAGLGSTLQSSTAIATYKAQIDKALAEADALKADAAAQVVVAEKADAAATDAYTNLNSGADAADRQTATIAKSLQQAVAAQSAAIAAVDRADKAATSANDKLFGAGGADSVAQTLDTFLSARTADSTLNDIYTRLTAANGAWETAKTIYNTTINAANTGLKAKVGTLKDDIDKIINDPLDTNDFAALTTPSQANALLAQKYAYNAANKAQQATDLAATIEAQKAVIDQKVAQILALKAEADAYVAKIVAPTQIVAAADVATVSEDGTFVTINVLANDKRADGAALNTADIVSAPASTPHGSITVSGGSIIYTPTHADYNGTDTFTITVRNTVTINGVSYETTSTSTVTVTITPVNDRPVLDVSVTPTLTAINELGAQFSQTGGSGADTITGTANSDVLNGGAGNDVLSGGGGRDTLAGGTGADTLTGGSGNDIFVIGSGESSSAAADTITDFVTGADRIQFTGMGGIAYSTTPYSTSQTTVTGIVNAIKGDGAIANKAVFFTLGGNGYVYVKGAGTGANFDDTLVRLNGITTAPAATDLVGVTGGGTSAMMGSLVSDLLTGRVTDVDNPTVAPGIGITALDTSHGTWQFSSNNGVTWTTITTPGADQAFLLAGTDRVRFVPTAGWNGSLSGNAFSFKAWDRSAGTAGQLLSGVAASTALSTATLGTNLTVNAVAYAPVVSVEPAPYAVTAGGAVALSIALSSVTDTVSIEISGVPSNATLTYDGGTITAPSAGQPYVLTQAQLSGLTLNPAAGHAAAIPLTVTVIATDGASTESVSTPINVSFGVQDVAVNGFYDGSASGRPLNLVGGAANDTMIGGSGGDTLSGDGGNDTLSGGGGNDTFIGSSGTDRIFGGTASADSGTGDTISYAAQTGAVSVNLATGTASGAGGTATLSGIENAIGGSGNDSLTGSSGANVLTGGAGNDLLVGGGGADSLTGGTGADTFRLTGSGESTASARDTITDFVSGTDVIQLQGANYAYLRGAYTYTTDVTATVANIVADTTVTNAAVFFTDGTDGYLYIKGAGTATSFDGTLIKLAGVTSQPSQSSLSGISSELLFGTSGNNTLTADAGIDTLVGGAGNDVFRFTAGTDSPASAPDVIGDFTNDDTILFQGIAGLSLTRTAYTYTTSPAVTVANIVADANVSNAVIYFTDGTHGYLYVKGAGTGTSYDGSLVVLTNRNTIPALGSLTGITTEVTYGTSGADTLTGVAGSDTLVGGGGNDTFIATSGTDVIYGGNAGADSGTGDTLSFATETSAVTVNLGAGASTGAGGNQTLYGIENAIGGSGNDTFTGSSGNNTLIGGNGDDLFYATAGTDSIAGGNGTDTINYGSETGAVVVNLAAGTASGAGGTATLSSIENVQTGSGNDTLTGDSGTNILQTGGGFDTLAGGGGADTLTGSTGDDVFLYTAATDSTAAAIDVITDFGTDVIQFQGANYAYLRGAYTYTTDAATTVAAIDSDARVTNAAVFFTDGSDGYLYVKGAGAGTSYAGTLIKLAGITSQPSQSRLSGLSSELLIGTSGDETLTADAGADTLVGAAGNDVFRFTAATDSPTSAPDVIGDFSAGDTIQFQGIAGIALARGYSYSGSPAATVAAIVADSRIANTAVFFSDGTHGYLYVKGAGTGTSFDGSLVVLTNQTTAPVLADLPGFSAELVVGTAADDTLTGGGGSDTLMGGAGDDTFIGTPGADVIYGGTPSGDAGTGDTLSFATETSSMTVDLGAGSANGVQTLHGIENAIGGSGNDTFTGSSGNNILAGANGDDLFIGTGGTDVYLGGNGTDTINYGSDSSAVVVDLTAGTASGAGGTATLSSIENVQTGSGNDTLTGGSGSNFLDAGFGADTLTGGGGADTLMGSGGADLFRFVAASDSTEAATDVITDFGDGADKIRFMGAELSYPGTAYTYGSSVADTIAAIVADGGVSNTIVFFTDTTDGYLYVKGAGTGTNFDGTLIKLAGITTAPSVSDVLCTTTNETLTGTSGNDTLTADAGNDTLVASAGADTLDGGGGTDTVTYAGQSTPVVVNLATGTASGAGGTAVLSNIENAVGGSAADTLTGGSGANVLTGNDGDDTFFASAGNDSYVGGNGTDSVVYTGFTAGGLVANLTEQTFTQGTVELAGGQVYRISTVVGGYGTDTLSGIESVTGCATNDLFVLSSVTGTLTVKGAAGNDIYALVPDSDNLITGTLVIEDSAGSADTIDVSRIGMWMLQGFTRTGNDLILSMKAEAGGGQVVIKNHFAGNAIEWFSDGPGDLMSVNDTSGTAADEVLVGTTAAETLVGNGGEDDFWGGGGADTFIGDGDDWADFDMSVGPVNMTTALDDGEGYGTFSTVLSAAGQTVTMYGIKGITGGIYNDTLHGGFASDNHFTWWLEGNDGADTLISHAENTGIGYEIDPAGVGVNLSGGEQIVILNGLTENLADQTALDGWGNVDTLIGVFSHIDGSAFDDVLYGYTTGYNYMWFRPGGGDDTVVGGYGWDGVDYGDASSAVAVNLSDTSVIRGGNTIAAHSGMDGDGGTDLLTNIDAINGSDFGDLLIGNDEDNQLHGGAGADTLQGGAGSDTVSYQLWDETATHGATVNLSSSSVTVSVNGESVTVAANTAYDSSNSVDLLDGIEAVTGSHLNDTLIGGSGEDTLFGNAGDDYLDIGGGSQDPYRGTPYEFADGGDGNDTIVYRADAMLDGGNGIDTLKIAAGTTAADLTHVYGAYGFEAIDLSAGNIELTLDVEGIVSMGGGGVLTVNGQAGDSVFLGAGWTAAGTETIAGNTYSVFSQFYAPQSMNVTVLVDTDIGMSGQQLVYVGEVGFDATDGGYLTGLRIVGSSFGDYVTATSHDDAILGRGGNDTVDGGAGTDTFYAGPHASGQTATLTNVEVVKTGDLKVAADASAGMAKTALLQDGVGSYVVAWVANDAGQTGIYAQRFWSNGSKQGDPVLVNTTTAGYQDGVSVTGLDDGGYLVVWASDGQDGNSYGVYGQRFDDYGDPVGIEFRINTDASRMEYMPSVTALADGGYVVTWTATGGGVGSTVWARVYSAADVGGTDFQVDNAANTFQGECSVAVLGTGFVVAYKKDGEVYTRVYDGDGTAVSSILQVNTYTADTQGAPAVTALANGQYVVTWSSYRGDMDSREHIYARVYNADGTPATGEFPVSTATGGGAEQDYSAVVPYGADGFVVLWTAYNQDGDSADVCGQVFGAGGTKIGGEFRVNGEQGGYQSWPSVTPAENGGFIVTWTSSGNSSSHANGVFAQVFDMNASTGDDQIIFDGVPTGGIIDLGTGNDRVTLASAASVTVKNVETVAGSMGDDVIVGDGTSTTFIGSMGNDTLTGGGGSDVFVLTNDPSTSDRITDFNVALDTLRFTDMGGMRYSQTPYAWTTSVAATVAAIVADGGVDNRIVFFTDGTDGWIYVKGGGTGGFGYDGTLVKLDGVTAAPPSSALGEYRGLFAVNTLTGTAGIDTLAGGEDNDFIEGLEDADTLSGGDGNDTLVGGDGADTLTGGLGKDVFTLSVASDSTVANMDVITDFNAVQGDKLVLNGSAHEYQPFAYPYITSLAGTIADIEANALLTNYRALFFSDGTDGYIYVKGDGTLVKLAGVTTAPPLSNLEGVTSTYAHNQIWGTDVIDTLAGTSGADVLFGRDGADTLMAGGGNDVLIGGNGADTLTGGAGTDVFRLVGGSVLESSQSNGCDVITDFTPGADYSSSDIIQFGNMGGIEYKGGAFGWEGTVAATVAAIEANAAVTDRLAFFTDGTDGWLYVKGIGNSDNHNTTLIKLLGVTTAPPHFSIENAYFSYYQTEFVGGSGADIFAGTSGMDLLSGGAGADTLSGGADGDTLIGGAGADTLTGGDGVDTFVYTSGGDSDPGSTDRITDFTDQADILRFTGISGIAYNGSSQAWAGTVAATVSLIQNNAAVQDEMIFLTDGTVGYLYVKGAGSGISYDGTLIRLDGVTTAPSAGSIDTVVSGQPATLFGTSGADTLAGTAGDEVVYGLAGADTLSAGVGNDIVIGGAGADTLTGGLGFDLFKLDNGDFAAGEIIDGTAEAGTLDTIRLTGGAVSVSLGTGVSNIDVVELGVDAAHNLTVTDAMVATADANRDGVAGDLLIKASTVHATGVTIDVSSVTAGTISVDGANLQGNDQIWVDVSQLTGNVLPVNFSTATWQMTTNASHSDAQTVTVLGPTSIRFYQHDNGSSMEAGWPPSADWYFKTTVTQTGVMDISWTFEGFNSWYLSHADAWIFNETQGTSVHWAGGGTTLAVNAGDVLGFQIQAGNYDGTNVATNTLTVTYRCAGIDAGLGNDTLTVVGAGSLADAGFAQIGHVETVAFTDLTSVILGANSQGAGVTLLDGSGATAGFAATASGRTDGIALLGGAFADTLTGGSGNDTLTGGAGNDTLVMGTGNDFMYGGSGADVFTLNHPGTAGYVTLMDFTIGEGDTFLNNYASPGAYYLTYSGELHSLTNDSHVIVFAGSSDNPNSTEYSITDWGGDGYFLTETDDSGGLTGGGAADLLAFYGTTAGKAMYGNALPDTLMDFTNYGNTLDGGTGDDFIYGGMGADTLVGGDGDDTFLYNAASEMAAGETINGGAGTDTLYLCNDAGSPQSYNLSANVTYVDQIGLGGGNIAITLSDFGVLTSTWGGVSGKFGIAGASTLDSALSSGVSVDASSVSSSGSIVVDGTLLGGDDTFIGGGGNDTLNGGAGDDTLIGGVGSDTLTGGSGSDTFELANYLLGSDTITDFTTGQDSFVLKDTGFALGTVGTLTDGSSYFETNVALNGTGVSFGSGCGVVVIGGGANLEVWYTADLSDASTSNSYQIATLAGSNDTANVAAADFKLA